MAETTPSALMAIACCENQKLIDVIGTEPMGNAAWHRNDAAECACHLDAPKRYRPGNRPWPLAHPPSVIAALDHPLIALSSRDDANMMAPDHDGADVRAARVGTLMRPIPGEPETAIGFPKMLPEPPPAPGPRTRTKGSRNLPPDTTRKR